MYAFPIIQDSAIFDYPTIQHQHHRSRIVLYHKLTYLATESLACSTQMMTEHPSTR